MTPTMTNLPRTHTHTHTHTHNKENYFLNDSSKFGICINSIVTPSIEKEEKDLGVVIQDNLSPEKHIDRIFGNTFMMLRNIQTAFHFQNKDMMRKIITSMIKSKLEKYAEVIWSHYKKKHLLKLDRKQRIATKMVPELKDLTYEKRLKEMQLNTLEKRKR